MDISRADLIIAEHRGDVTVLLATLRSADPAQRAAALGSLHRHGSLSNDVLGTALSDTDRNVRVRAIELAVTTPDIELVSMLSDADDLVVETAAWALGERQDATSHTIEALSEVATGHEISICREAAIAALGAIGSPAGLAAILAGINDRTPIRRRAVLALPLLMARRCTLRCSRP